MLDSSKQDKWDALAYVWNDEQTDADLNIIGDTKSLDWIDKNGNKVHDDYSVPNKTSVKPVMLLMVRLHRSALRCAT